MIMLDFSNWAQWGNRLDLLKDLHFPGVYALLISDDDMSGKPFEWQKEIVYFGMTNSVTGLKGRLSQFNNTLHDKRGHGGGERFRFDYGDGADLAKKLFVSVCPFACEGHENTPANLRIFGTVAMAEYIAFAEYVDRYGALPKYNDKKVSPKRKKSGFH